MKNNFIISKQFIFMLGLLTALVAFAIDISLPAIPTMVRSLNTSISLGQQVIGVFMAGMAIGQIPFGLWSDRLGRLPILFFGIGIFTIAGAVTSTSQDINILLIARFIQGFGSSAGLVLSRAMVRDISSGRDSARILSAMVMVFTSAPMIAPIFGAALTDYFGWRGPFAATTIAGLMIICGIKLTLRETLEFQKQPKIHIQLIQSLKQFFSHGASQFGLLIVSVTLMGIFPFITGSVAIVVEIYGYSVKFFGYMFATSGIAILIGSSINRKLLLYFDELKIIGLGATLASLAGIQLLFMINQTEVAFWWLWINLCIFMFSTAFLLPNATSIALNPVPKIAGVAASIIGTMQSLAGAISAIISSSLYTGTINNVITIVSISGLTTFIIYLMRYNFIAKTSTQ